MALMLCIGGKGDMGGLPHGYSYQRDDVQCVTSPASAVSRCSTKGWGAV